MKFIDLFSGIGGFRLGMEQAGHQCVGFCEIDKYARQSYKAIHDTRGEWEAHDIRTVDPMELPEADCYTAGFPCQSFSVAGKRGGFEDTRGTLFFEIMRLAKARQPKCLLLENVKGLLSHDGGKTFGTILSTLWELGYHAEWQVCNSKDFGVPQNRERVFIIGHLRGQRTRKVFPITKRCSSTILVVGNTNPSGNGMNGQVFDSKGLCPTLTTNKGEGQKVLVRPVLTPDREEIRRLTPLECFRLQRFPDEAFHKAKAAGVSDSQMYKQAGNSVTVNVIHEIARRLKI